MLSPINSRANEIWSGLSCGFPPSSPFFSPFLSECRSRAPTRLCGSGAPQKSRVGISRQRGLMTAPFLVPRTFPPPPSFFSFFSRSTFRSCSHFCFLLHICMHLMSFCEPPSPPSPLPFSRFSETVLRIQGATWNAAQSHRGLFFSLSLP